MSIQTLFTGDVFGPTFSNIITNFKRVFNGRTLKSSDGIAFNFGTTIWTLHYFRLTNQMATINPISAFKFLNVQLEGLIARIKNGGFKMWNFSQPSVWFV